MAQFEKVITELRDFYQESQNIIPKSKKEYELVGLYLLFLIYSHKYNTIENSRISFRA